MCDRAKFFEKNFFAPKNGENGPKIGFFEFIEKFGHWIILRSSRGAFFDFMNYSHFIIFDKDKLVFQFIDFIRESTYWKEYIIFDKDKLVFQFIDFIRESTYWKE